MSAPYTYSFVLSVKSNLMSTKLSKEEKVKIFEDAAKYPYLEVGYNNELDEIYSTDQSLQAGVGRIVRDVAEHPESYNISQDKVDIVMELVKERRSAGPTPAERTFSHKKIQKEMEKGIEEIVTGNRNKLSAVLSKKIDNLLRDDDQLKNTSLTQLSTAFGIMFDKSQLLQGKATDHIAFQGKIDGDMSPEDAIEAVVKMREANIDKNT